MFILVDGIMGSGKTYYAVDLIFKSRDKYHRIYTNINGFVYQDNIEPLYWDVASDGLVMLDHFSRLREIYDDPSTSDDDLIDYLIDVGIVHRNGSDILPSLIVIDEAQNYFDSRNDLLVWIQTYHRHLFLDFVLITQSYELLNRIYWKQFEYVIHAISQSRQLLRRFKYQKHIAVPYRDGKFGTKVSDIYLKPDSRVFKLYKSGDKVRVDSVFRKYFIYIAVFVVGGLILAYFMFDYFLSPPESSLKQRRSIDHNTTARIVKNSSSQLSFSDGDRYLIIRCIGGLCKDFDHRIEFVIDDLPKLLEVTSSTFLRKEIKAPHYVVLYLLASQDFFNLFQGVSNEKSSFTFNPFAGPASGKAR